MMGRNIECLKYFEYKCKNEVHIYNNIHTLRPVILRLWINEMKKSFLLAWILLAAISLSAQDIPIQPKNVIIMISDGMGFMHNDIASIYRYGYPQGQSYWNFTHLAVSTYSAETPGGYDPHLIYSDFAYMKTKPTESSAAATAISSGVKTNNICLGVDPEGNPVRHIMEDAEAMGKATGVVSTMFFSHATPAGFIAHATSRELYSEIANYMLWQSAADVIITAGHPWYNDDGQQVGGRYPFFFDTPLSYDRVGGLDSWKKILRGEAGADADGDGVPDPWTFVETRQAIRGLARGNPPKRVLGIAQVYSTLQQGRSGNAYREPYGDPLLADSPTLKEFTAAALNVLSKDPDGFVLMAEGGAVDMACHANQSGRMIEEMIDFDRAVDSVIDWIELRSNWEDTLLLVMADHECGYITGPGSDPTWQPLINYGAGIMPGFEWHHDFHTNQLVPLFIKGANAERILEKARGVDLWRGLYIDNTDISQFIRELWAESKTAIESPVHDWSVYDR